MRKLTFERAVLIVFILIILISTSDITGKYISIFLNRFDKSLIGTVPSGSSGFTTALVSADNLYADGEFEEAAEQYLASILNNTLTIEQKIHAYFNLGVCHYNLGNYEKASNSFVEVAALSPDDSDSVAYNNAAVSAYRANDMKGAVELQQKSIEILPAVEYYYNLARIYEDNEEYELAVSNYQVVAIGEQNITKVERIDPVRVKEKTARLLSKNPTSVSEVVKNVFNAYKLSNDNRIILTVNENEMKLKEVDFIVKVENQKNTKSIVAQYDRAKNDPYNLISELLWTVYRDGKELYKKSADQITAPVKDVGNYEVKLNIKYNGSNEKVATKTVRVKENQSMVNDGTTNEIVVKPPVNEDIKTYTGAIYEQLFESNFKISSSGYTDKYSVIWGKDTGVETSVSKVRVDMLNSLAVSNMSKSDAGLWINLDSLLKDEKLKGKTIRINFYAREITDDTDINISMRVKTNNMIATTPKSFSLPFRFEQQYANVYIPKDATGFTVSIKTKSLGEFSIDGFYIID